MRPGVLWWGESFVSCIVMTSMLWVFVICSISVILFLRPLMFICSMLSVLGLRWFVGGWGCLVVVCCCLGLVCVFVCVLGVVCEL